MSIFNAILRSLGFGKDVDDGLLADSAETPFESSGGSPAPSQFQTAEISEDVVVDANAVERIFDHVVKVFNEALPDFLSQSVEPEAQRKQLYDSLDKSLKDYLAEITAQTRRQCEARWMAEQTEMRGEMEQLKAKAKEIEQQRFDIKQQQLSADRQRRALSNKVQSLENQVASFEAEREQFDLENKSLVNKLKVAAVHEAEAQALRDELTDARAEIVALRNAAVSGDSDAAVSPVANEDKETIARLELEISKLNDQLEQAAEKDRIASEMFNGLQSKASAARNELSARNQEIESLKQQLAEARSVQDEIADLNRQMSKVEEVIGKRDRKIAGLKETCAALRAENESLRTTINDNLNNYAQAEEQLKRRISELEADPISPIVSDDLTPVASEASAEYESTISEKIKISVSNLNAIDQNFDGEDWMTGEPAETPSMRSGVSDADFGYQAPSRKNHRPDNEAQLSLF